MASSAPKKRLQALSEQLQNPIRSEGKFEDLPNIPTVAGDSKGPYVHTYHDPLNLLIHCTTIHVF